MKASSEARAPMLIARILAGLFGAYFAFLALKDFSILLYRFDLIAFGIGAVKGSSLPSCCGSQRSRTIRASEGAWL